MVVNMSVVVEQPYHGVLGRELHSAVCYVPPPSSSSSGWQIRCRFPFFSAGCTILTYDKVELPVIIPYERVLIAIVPLILELAFVHNLHTHRWAKIDSRTARSATASQETTVNLSSCELKRRKGWERDYVDPLTPSCSTSSRHLSHSSLHLLSSSSSRRRANRNHP